MAKKRKVAPHRRAPAAPKEPQTPATLAELTPDPRNARVTGSGTLVAAARRPSTRHGAPRPLDWDRLLSRCAHVRRRGGLGRLVSGGRAGVEPEGWAVL